MCYENIASASVLSSNWLASFTHCLFISIFMMTVGQALAEQDLQDEGLLGSSIGIQSKIKVRNRATASLEFNMVSVELLLSNVSLAGSNDDTEFVGIPDFLIDTPSSSTPNSSFARSVY